MPNDDENADESADQNADEDQDENQQERGVAPLPLVPLPPPAGSVDGALDLGPVPDAQRLQPPSADAQRLQQPPTHHDPQRLGTDRVDAQRGQPNADAQRANPTEHATESQRVESMEHAADAQRAASDVRKASRVGRARSFRQLRPRTRFLVASAAAIAAGGGTVLIVNAQDDDTPAAAPTTSVVVAEATTDVRAASTEPAAVVITDAPTTVETTIAATTIAETTIVETTLAPTTVVATTLVPTAAGSYTVTVADTVINSSETGTVVVPSQQPAEQWTLAGACDGVGPCTMSLVAIGLGSGAPNAGAIQSLEMTPSGSGTYVGTMDLTADAPGCGTGTAEFAVTFGPGAFNGTYLATFTGAADCPAFTISSSYTGMLTG